MNTGNAFSGVSLVLVVMAAIVTSPLWYNIWVASSESQSKVACKNLETAKKNKAAYTESVNRCAAADKTANQNRLLHQCQMQARRNYPVSQDDFPSLSMFGISDTRAYTEARANGCGE